MTTYRPSDPDHSVNRGKANPLSDFAILAAGTVAGIILVLAAIVFFSDKIVQLIPLEKEVQWVQKWNSSTNKKKDFNSTTSPQSNFLTQLTNELWSPFKPSEQTRLSLKITQNKQENAFMELGGKLTLTSTFLNNVKSENELSFVLCHELGHFYHRDVARGLSRSLLVLLAQRAVGLSQVSLPFIDSGVQSALLKYSRDQETRADLFAIDCLFQRYQHISGFDAFFKRLGKNEGIEKALSLYSDYHRSHPFSHKRIERMTNYAKEKGIPMNGELKPLKKLNP